MAPPEEYDEDDRDDFDGEGSPEAGAPLGEEDRSDDDVDREEDAAEDEQRRTLEERAQRAAARGEQQQQPAAEVDRIMALLPEAYRTAVRAGTLTPDAALSRHLENQRQHIGRIHTKNDALEQQLRQSAAEARAREERTAARLERLMKHMGVEEDAADRQPTLEEEPGRYLAGQLDQLRGEVAAGREEAAQQVAAAQEEAAIQGEIGQVRDYNASDYASAAAEIPDYDQAEEFLVGKVFAAEQLRLTEAFPSATSEQIRAQAAANVHQMSANLQVHARRNGISLAREVYKAAVQNGYQGVRQAPAPAAPSRSRQRADQQLARQRSAETIAGTPPRLAPPSESEMWNKIIYEMTDDEFEELFPDGPEGDREFEEVLRQFAHPA